MRKTYVLELRQLRSRKDKNIYQRKLTRYDKQVADLKIEFKWLKSTRNKNNDNGIGNKNNELYNANRTLKAAQDTQLKTQAAGERILSKIVQTKDIGGVIIENLDQQTKQIKGVAEEINHIQDDLTRADKLMRTFARRMMMDKMISDQILKLLIIGTM